jgi:hypothetical protein
LVKVNYQREKRQKELARKKKKEEKRLRKLDKGGAQTGPVPDSPEKGNETD